MTAGHLSGDGGIIGGVAPENVPLWIDELETEVPEAVVGEAMHGEFARVGHGSGGQIRKRKLESGKEKEKKYGVRNAECGRT